MQVHVAVETVEVLRKHGLNGIYTLVLRKEFVQAANLLQRVARINKSTYPLSIHELTAAIFYSLAEKQAERGNRPGGEDYTHRCKGPGGGDSDDKEGLKGETLEDTTDEFDPLSVSVANLLNRVDDFLAPPTSPPPTTPDQSSSSLPPPSGGVCSPLASDLLSSLLFYSPLSLNFIYAQTPIEMQLLSAQQGWSLLYANLDQGALEISQPASALLVHRARKIVCVVVRGTTTLNDVVTDLRAIPVPFPEGGEGGTTSSDEEEREWVKMESGGGQALMGMAKSATYLFEENIKVLAGLVGRGYVVRCTGHSLGGGVACLLGILIKGHFKRVGFNGDDIVRVYSFGTPSCVNEDLVKDEGDTDFITSVVLHDDIVPRISPTSIRR